MLSVAVHKDIAEYQPKLVGKMTARTLLGIGGALGSAVASGLYLYFVLGVSVSDYVFIIYLVSLPFWCIAFFKPKGMPFEKFAPLWVKNKLFDDRIYYKPTMILIGLVESPRKKGKEHRYGKYYAKQCRLHGIESYSPRTGHVLI